MAERKAEGKADDRGKPGCLTPRFLSKAKAFGKRAPGGSDDAG
jgi:hypothetical protein